MYDLRKLWGFQFERVRYISSINDCWSQSEMGVRYKAGLSRTKHVQNSSHRPRRSITCTTHLRTRYCRGRQGRLARNWDKENEALEPIPIPSPHTSIQSLVTCPPFAQSFAQLHPAFPHSSRPRSQRNRYIISCIYLISTEPKEPENGRFWYVDLMPLSMRC